MSSGQVPMISSKSFILFLSAIILVFSLISCAPKFGEIIISQPDEYRRTYEAREKYVLRATARIFQGKKMGSNVRVDQVNKQVETDYIVQGDWRTRSMAKVSRLSWKESELVLSVITEKKTETGWEMRRLLEAEQYANLFDKIDLLIYEEMSKIE